MKGVVRKKGMVMESNNPSFTYIMTEEKIKKYEREGFWKERCYPDHLERNLAKFPQNEAFVDQRGRITFADLNRIVNNLASNLVEMGIRKNDVIGVQVPNRVEYFFMKYALAKIGAVILNIGIGLRERELLYILGASDAKGIVSPVAFHNFNHWGMIKTVQKSLPSLEYVLLLDWREEERPSGVYPFDAMISNRTINDQLKNYRRLLKGPNEIDMLSLTSGTTGNPKICQFTPNARMLFGKQIMQRCGITSDDVMLVICPVTQGLGNSCSSQAAAYAGAKVVLLERFEEKEALKLIEIERATILVGIPSQYIKMLSIDRFDHYDLSSLRMVISAGSYLPYDTAKEIIRRMEVKLIQIYGTHDGGTLTVGTPDLDEETVSKTVSRPLPDAELKIVDSEGAEVTKGEIGEIVYRSANGCAGYLGDLDGTKAAFDSEGYFHSGDLGRLTKEGFLEIKGRIKDIINRGGQKINPEEIEEVLIDHPDVENVAIVGMPDPMLGEKSCAYVVSKKGRTFTFDQMKTYLKEKGVALFKFPERLEMVGEIPVSEGKKPAKNILRKDIAEKLKREGPKQES